MPAAKLALERGSVWLNKKSVTGWTLDKGKGDRTFEHEITFANPFPTPPKVFAAFSAVDIMNDDDTRITCLVTTITTTGFKFEVGTWGSTHVWSCAVGWLAYDKDAAQVQGARIESGRVPLKKTNPGWKLDKGNGKRLHTQKVNYEKSFPTFTTNAPIVLVGFCVLDILIDDDDHHLKLSSKNIDRFGFELEVETWKKTKIWGVSVNYIAFEGELQLSTGAKLQAGVLPITKTTPNSKKLTQGDGERKVTGEVTFDTQFDEAPQVLTFLSMQDIFKGADLRIKTTPKEIKETGFEVEVATWSDTKVYGCHVSWLAFTNGDTIYASSSSSAAASSSSSTTTTTTTTSSTPSTPPPKNDASDDEDDKPKKKEKKKDDDEEKEEKEAEKSEKGKKTKTSKAKEKEKEKEKDEDKEKDSLSGTKRKDTDEAEDDNVCKVCMDAKVNTCLVPCGHLCLCQGCADEVKKHKEPCPICRGLIKQIVVTFAA